MEDPAREIEHVIQSLTATSDPDVQKEAVERFYAPNAEFRHPLCTVPSSPTSRDALLGIFQWYRVMSPTIKLETRSVTYDSQKDELFVECVQEFHIRFSPFHPAPSRLLVHLKLKRSDTNPSLHVITYHEDFYHPEDLTALILPPLVPIIRGMLLIGTIASNINSRIGAFFGLWTTREEDRKNK
ncbi:hypothetical protein QCA50_013720 [Cerrena zonata]|uniref:SigF-like NTF2-like domain-containing protein n=1 Tax=Cerrena zonata TaxID=2478898 RepID=A0AAW0FN07_9APHY